MENTNYSTNNVPFMDGASIKEKVLFLKELTKTAFFNQFKDAINELEQTEPNWYLATIKKIELFAVKQLRDLLENKDYWATLPDPKPLVNWLHPSATTVFSIPWENIENKIPKEQIKEIRTELTPTEQKKMLEELLSHFVLQTLHGGISFISSKIIGDRGNNSFEFIPQFLPFIKEILNQWPNEQEAIIEELEKPLYLYEDSTPTGVTKQKHTETPGMWFQCNINNECLAGYLIIEFHPFIIDTENKQAFHPVTAKILIAGITQQGGKVYKPTPHSWPREWRNAFWEKIVGHLEENLAKLEKQTPSGVSLADPPILVDKEAFPTVQEKDLQIRGAYRKQIAPHRLQQPTYPEALCLAIAITDGQFLLNWQPDQTRKAYIHGRPNQPIRFEYASKPVFNQTDQDEISMERLRSEIQDFTAVTADLLRLVIAWGTEEQRVTADIDYLIKEIGLEPRNATEKLTMRQDAWNWLLRIDSMTAIGKRRGTYKDPITGKPLDISITDSLIKIIAREDIGSQALHLYDKTPPKTVTWVVGNWLERFRGNNKILPSFGKIKNITSIAPGKAAGAWARSIAAALNQFWQEEQGKRSKPFTRFQLLNLFRCQPWVEDVLYKSKNPNRAKEYWEVARHSLSHGENAIIGFYEEIDVLNTNRKGWQDSWLNEQRINIRPIEKC